MTAAPSRPSHHLHSYPRPDVDTAGPQKSRSKVLPQSSGPARASDLAGGQVHRRARALAGRRGGAALEAEGFRDWFAPAFARWLQANFRDAELVASLFGVRYQTALNWWNGAHRASGDTVALVFMAYPQAVSWFLSEWKGRA